MHQVPQRPPVGQKRAFSAGFDVRRVLRPGEVQPSARARLRRERPADGPHRGEGDTAMRVKRSVKVSQQPKRRTWTVAVLLVVACLGSLL